MPAGVDLNNNPNPSLAVNLVFSETARTWTQFTSNSIKPNTNTNKNADNTKHSLPSALKWSLEESRKQLLAASKTRRKSKRSRTSTRSIKNHRDNISQPTSTNGIAVSIAHPAKDSASSVLKNSDDNPGPAVSISMKKQKRRARKLEEKCLKTRSKQSSSKSRTSSGRSKKKGNKDTKCFKDMESIDAFIHKYKPNDTKNPSIKKEEQKNKLPPRERLKTENKLEGVFEFVKHFRNWKTSRNESSGSTEESKNAYSSSEEAHEEPKPEELAPKRRKKSTRRHSRKSTLESSSLKIEKGDSNIDPELPRRSKKSKKSKASRSVLPGVICPVSQKQSRKKSRKHKSSHSADKELDSRVGKKVRKEKRDIISSIELDSFGSEAISPGVNKQRTNQTTIISEDHYGPRSAFSSDNLSTDGLIHGNAPDISSDTWNSISCVSELDPKTATLNIASKLKPCNTMFGAGSTCATNVQKEEENTTGFSYFGHGDQQNLQPSANYSGGFTRCEKSVLNEDPENLSSQSLEENNDYVGQKMPSNPLLLYSKKMNIEICPKNADTKPLSVSSDMERIAVDLNRGINYNSPPIIQSACSSKEAKLEDKRPGTLNSTGEDQNTFLKFVDRADKLKEQIKSTSRTSDIWDLFDALQDLKNCFTNLDQERHRNKEGGRGQTALVQALSSRRIVVEPELKVDLKPIEEEEEVNTEEINASKDNRTWGDCLRDARTLVKATGDGRVIKTDGDLQNEDENNSGGIIFTKKNDDPVLSRSWNPSPFPQKDLQAPFDGLSKEASPHTEEDLYWLKKAIGLSRYATCRDHPFASILINSDNKLVAADINFHFATFELKNHAEMRMLRKAANSSLLVDGYKGCTIYCSTEPCVHCSQVIEKSGIRRIVYGCPKYLMMKIRKSCRDALDWHSQSFDAFWQPAFRYRKDTQLVGPLLKEVAADVHRKYWLAYYDGEENKTEFKNKWRLKLTGLWGGDKSCGLLLNNLK